MEFVNADGEFVRVTRIGALVRRPFDGLRLVSSIPEGYNEELTVQSAEPECNLNTVVARWLSGQPVPEFEPMQFGDVTGVRDIAEIRQRILDMGELFMKVPAEVRARFKNDALLFAEAVADPSRADEMRQLGLFPESKGEAPAGESAKPAIPAVPKPADSGDKPA